MIARVRSGDDDRDAAIARRVDHRQRRLAHAQQAHLAQIVEAVLVEDRIVRAMTIERAAPLGLRLGEHRVEQRDVVAVRSHGGRRIQRSQRRVRLACIPELRIEPQEVGLAEQDDRVRGVNSVHRVRQVHGVGNVHWVPEALGVRAATWGWVTGASTATPGYAATGTAVPVRGVPAASR